MRLSRKIGAGLALAHVILFVLFTLYLNASTDGQAHLLWALWLPLDFPVSLLVDFGFELSNYLGEAGHLFKMWLPYIVHGVFGTIWWFFVPTVIATIYTALAKAILHK